MDCCVNSEAEPARSRAAAPHMLPGIDFYTASITSDQSMAGSLSSPATPKMRSPAFRTRPRMGVPRREFSVQAVLRFLSPEFADTDAEMAYWPARRRGRGYTLAPAS